MSAVAAKQTIDNHLKPGEKRQVKKDKTLSRRDFIKKSSAASVAISAAPVSMFSHAAGQPVEEMSVLTANASFDPVRPEMGRLITQACKQIGWDVKLAAEDYTLGIGKVFKEKDFDMFIVRWTGRANRIDPETFIYMQHHRDGNYNKWGYDNPKINELAEAQQVEMDADKRRAIVHEAQQALFDDAARSPIVYPAMTNAYREDRLEGLVPMVGEGIGSYWSDLNVSVKQGDGYVRTGQTSALKNLNPVSATDSNEFKELRMIYDRLVQIAPDGSITPWAAQSIEVVDPTTVDIVLREGMKFHDGKPVTIEDVKFSFERTLELNSFMQAYFGPITAINVVDPLTVEITLERPSAVFLSWLAMPQAAIVSPIAAETVPTVTQIRTYCSAG